MFNSVYKELPYRDDIQGLRAVSALLIMVHHIWINKVSGGVDVFLVVAGYLMACSILRKESATVKYDPVHGVVTYLSKSVPTAIFVLIACFFLSLVFVPPPLWKYAGNELIAATLQLQNFELIRMQADYFDREHPPSFIQHYWALSVIVQLYAICYMLFWAALRLCDMCKLSIKYILLLFFVLGLASFYYSVIYTYSAPSAAYFNTFSRAWQFIAGVLIGALLPLLKLSYGEKLEGKTAGKILFFVMLTSLVFFVTFGFVYDERHLFPGYISSVPVSLSILIILAGGLSSLAYKLSPLRLGLLVYLGSFSFTLYLWHWPVMVFFKWYFEILHFGLLHGLVVVFLSLILSLVTTKLFQSFFDKKVFVRRPALKVAFFVSIALFVFLPFRQGLVYLAKEQAGRFSDTSFVLGSDILEATLMDFATVDYDRAGEIPSFHKDGCSSSDISSEKTIVMLGSSHTRHWYDVLNGFAEAYGFCITVQRGWDFESLLQRGIPDYIFMVATHTDAKGQSEIIPDKYINIIDQASEHGIKVIGIRDNPRFDFFQNACLWSNKDTPNACAIPAERVFQAQNPLLELQDKKDNFVFVDMSDLYCNELCFAHHKEGFVYYDKHHFTKSFMLSMQEEFTSRLVFGLCKKGIFNSVFCTN